MSSSNANNEISNDNLSIEISDKRLRDEKNILEKIIAGTEKFISSLGEEIASVSQKIENMNLFKSEKFFFFGIESIYKNGGKLWKIC